MGIGLALLITIGGVILWATLVHGLLLAGQKLGEERMRIKFMTLGVPSYAESTRFRRISTTVAAWQQSTFKNYTPETIARLITEEAQELLSEPYDSLEMADVFILLMCLAEATSTDLLNAVEHKHAINLTRVYDQPPDEHGIIRRKR